MTTAGGRRRVFSAAAVLCSLVALVRVVPAQATYGAHEYFRLNDSEIVESSGLAPSSTSDHVWFTHNDSGDTARFFAVDDRGCTLTRYAVDGASATDWEDMARGVAGPSPVLWFADIGDNAFNRPFVTVYRVNEPTVGVPTTDGPCPEPGAAHVGSTRFDLAYPDGSHDAEAIFAHPQTGQLFIVTKAYKATDPTAVYAVPLDLRSDQTNVMTFVTTLPIPLNTSVPSNPTDAIPFGILPGSQLVTGADMAADGSRIVVRTYSHAYEWQVIDGDVAAAFATPSEEITLPGQPQGEAIAYSDDSTALVITSEDTLHTNPAVYRLDRSDG